MSLVKSDFQTNRNIISVKENNARFGNLNRTSGMKAPIMMLTGHENEVLTARFHPSGKTLASAGFERLIFLWNVYDNCENFLIFHGHKAPITELAFGAFGEKMVSSSIDKTVGLWDYETGVKIRVFRGHKSFVNCCAFFERGTELVASGSDDNTLKLWDSRVKECVQTLSCNYPVLSCCFDCFGNQVISAGIDNEIKVWDHKTGKEAMRLIGHSDTVTGLKLSPDGAYLLSNSMDNTMRMWDIYPYTNNANRCLKLFTGHSHNYEQNLIRCTFSSDSRYVASGSADSFLNVWDSVTGTLVYKLPGHKGTVYDVDFHPKEPIVLSCGSDSVIYLGELMN